MTDISRDLRLGNIHDWATGEIRTISDEESPPTSAIVFIHGILSDHRTFDKCHAKLSKTMTGWRFFYVDYDYHEPLAVNGNYLAQTLREQFIDEDRVVVIAHSMGGLLTRLACLSRDLPFMRAAFLLGTPNHGAFRTSALSIAAQMTLGSVRLLWGLRPKKVGIIDLTRVDHILEPHLEMAERTDHIDYVTVPGMYFHAQRGIMNHPASETLVVIFGSLDVGFDLIRGLLPLLSINMQRPHDGIVEEASNRLTHDRPEQRSEKRGSVRRAKNEPATYAHLQPDSARELLHVQITRDDFVIQMIKEILDESTLNDWIEPARAKHKKVMAVYDRDYPIE
jgi:pimeloyl-ACP methyl ester carboxylesterase